MKSFVLDASAVVGYVQSGPGSAKIEQLLIEASRQKQPLLMSVLNWGEVFYLIWQRTGEETARRTVANLSRLPIDLVPVDLALVMKAGELKATYKIPFVDCFAAALAIHYQATLVTSDRDFEKLGRHFPLLWTTRP